MAASAEYDTDTDPLITVLAVSATVVPRVLARPSLWLLLGLHLMAFSLHWTGRLSNDGHFTLDSEDLKVITAITTFFEVFYTNQCYSRYRELWSISREMLSKIIDFTYVVRLYTSSTGKPYDKLAVRWMLVSHMLFMHESKGLAMEEDDWEKLCRMGLVRWEEVGFLDKMTGLQRQTVLIHLAGCTAVAGIAEARHGPSLYKEVTSYLIKYRNLQAECGELLHFPIPFQYFHLLNLMIVCNLVAWAYRMAFSMSLFAPICFLLVALIFLGMMDLASQLSNPFGNDDVDFPLHVWAAECLSHACVLLNYNYQGAQNRFSEDLEEESRARRRIKMDVSELEDFLRGSPLPRTETLPQRRDLLSEKQGLLSKLGPSHHGSRSLGSTLRAEGGWR